MTTSTDGMSRPLEATSVATWGVRAGRGGSAALLASVQNGKRSKHQMNDGSLVCENPHQDVSLPALEFVQRPQPLWLAHLAMDGHATKAQVSEQEGDPPSVVTCPCKYLLVGSSKDAEYLRDLRNQHYPNNPLRSSQDKCDLSRFIKQRRFNAYSSPPLKSNRSAH